MLSVLNELEIGKVIIGKQGKESEQYALFRKIVDEKEIPVIVVKQGNIINIEKHLKIKILFPEDELITENVLNNNSLVFKLEYQRFEMLFTGDIEEVAEKQLLKMYSNGELKADVLKVAHHGSKSSTTEEFIKLVNPKIALIGVEKENSYGHPNNEVIERLEKYGAKIYRTDIYGEIRIKINKKGIYDIKTHIE